MTKEWVHPTVRRGTFWWRVQWIALIGVSARLAYVAVQDPSPGLLLAAGLAVVFAGTFPFFAEREIRKLRHEYRYDDDAGGTSTQTESDRQ
jgi:hypothetical protein